jgi:uncharacterized protein YkwD
MPQFERLEARDLPANGLTASLALGTLNVVGTNSATPIVVDIYAAPVRGTVLGYVVVEGVGIYAASNVRSVIINKPWSEPLVIHPGASWNPLIKVNQTNPPPPAPAPTPTPTPPPPSNSTQETAAELAIVAAVNQQRAANGLAPLTVNPKLVEAAHIHANDMAQFDVMAHDLPGAALPTLRDRANFVGYNFLSMGENIAFNYPDTPSVMNAWMNSPGHRANILNSSYTEIGVGIAYDRGGMPYYCQDFGQPA